MSLSDLYDIVLAHSTATGEPLASYIGNIFIAYQVAEGCDLPIDFVNVIRGLTPKRLPPVVN